jgi:hypothetical protein
MTTKKPEEYKTVGEASLALRQKDEQINPIDLQREILKGNTNEDSFENNVRDAVKRGASMFEGDFYVVVLNKKERLMVNVVRMYFIPRESCPTPEFDQTVYKYHARDHRLEYLWSVPDHMTTKALAGDVSNVSPEYWELASMCRRFINGDLDRQCCKLNGEVYE